MYLFLKTLFIFLSPFFVVFGFASVALFVSGEWYTLQVIEELQKKNSQPVLFGPAYSNFVQEYKKESTILRNPAVVSLGNSHTEQFRAAFFKDKKTFYNATGAVGAMSDYAFFVQSLGQYTPKILIINMDQGVFDPTGHGDYLVRPNPFVERETFLDTIVESLIRQQSWWKIYRDYFVGKFSLHDLLQKEGVLSVGLTARTHGGGYINDGSYHYGERDTGPIAQRNIAVDIDKIEASISDSNSFVFGNSISPAAIQKLREFLEICKEKDILVIGFMPPLPKKVYEKMDTFPSAPYHAMLQLLPETLSSVYTDYGFDFYDFSNPTWSGSSDEDMIDVYHGSEKMYLRMFIIMVQKNALLESFVDVSYLKERLSNAEYIYSVFDIEE